MLREFLAFSGSVLVAGLGVGFLGEREEEPGGNRLPTQQLTPLLISISSYSHKPNCLTFQQGSHVNRAFLVASSKSASFCLEGEVGYGEHVANLSRSVPISEIWFSGEEKQGEFVSLNGRQLIVRWSLQEDCSLKAMSLIYNIYNGFVGRCYYINGRHGP